MKYMYKTSVWVNEGETIEIPDGAICIEFDVINHMCEQTNRLVQERRVQWLEPC